MNKIKLNSIFLFTFFTLSSMFVFQSCEKEDEGCDEDNISIAGDDESHNAGQNCMQCHYDGGEGEGCFVVAGTVYDSLQQNTKTSGSIEFYTEPNGQGQLIKTVAIYKKGNFFTTDLFNLQGLYPVSVGTNGSKQYMGSALTSGQCNSCHGVTTNKIWVN
jgi:cytochrome c553